MKKGERGQKLNDKKCNDKNNESGEVYKYMLNHKI